MGEIKKTEAIILNQKELAPDIYEMLLEAPEIASVAKPGQFINIYVNNPAKILPRPISLCGIEAKAGTLRLVYRKGQRHSGTEELSSYESITSTVMGAAHGGQSRLQVTGPLGNGFVLEGERPLLIGGGIGIPPMLQLCKSFLEQGIRPVVALGYRTGREKMYLLEEFEEIADLALSTDDGSKGVKGTVIDAIRKRGELNQYDRIYACGPTPMLRGVKALGQELGVRTYVSMEERMACGVGACLACVCKTNGVDEHSHVHNARVCKEGPVFDAMDLDL